MAKILVVDDEPLIALALETELQDAGYEVVTAANGRQGLERLAEMPRPDLIVLDMMMPVMNGAAMLAEMASRPDLRDLPVIVLSSLPEEAIRARAQRAVAILRKPCTLSEVLDAIARVLQSRQPGFRVP
jgi:CheY-like chemotaxis protein